MDNDIINNLSDILENKLTYQKLSEREKPLKTGFEMLDNYLEGGITPGLLVLGAGPGQGKSTFALQLAEHISGSENVPVLYFSLEMTEDRVAAKMMTMDSFRHAKHEGFPVNCFQNGEEAKKQFFSASELFNPEKLEALTDDKRRQFEEAQTRVAENKNLYIIDKPRCASQIVKTVKDFIETQANERDSTDQPPRKPMVIVDYLQILPPEPDGKGSSTDKQQVERNLKTLRELVRKNIPVFLISSLKRGNYSGKGTGPMRMDSFKETGGIEYSADVLMGLQFSACYNKDGCNPDDEKKKYPRDMELIILKQRYGSTDVGIPLWYYAEFDYFEEKSPEKLNNEQTKKPVEQTAVSPKTAEPAAEPHVTEIANEDTQPEPPKAPGVTGKTQRKRGNIAYMNNTKVATEIRNGHGRNGESFRCNVASHDKESVITSFYIKEDLTHYDCDVADAVYSLYLNGHKSFTLRQVLHALTGDKTQTLTEPKKKELEESLQHLMSAEISIDCTDEMVKLYKKPELLNQDKKVIFSGKLLGAELKNGKYEINGENAMPLYHYAEVKGQMISFPERLLARRLADGTKLPDNRDNIQIKRYLLRRLERIRNGTSAGRHLQKVNYYSNKAGKCTGMLAHLGVKQQDFEEPIRWKNKLEQTHKSVKAILDCFVQYGYIGKYTEIGSSGVELPAKVMNPFDLE